MGLVGHSQGGTLAFMALADDPWLAESVTVVVAMAPCVYVKYMTSPVLTTFMSQANVRMGQLVAGQLGGGEGARGEGLPVYNI